MNRIDGRAYDQLRPVKITPGFVDFAEGSVLIECGRTKVLCCASVEEGAPRHVPEGTGWVTAEYSMLPRANRERSRRDVSKLKLSPRSAVRAGKLERNPIRGYVAAVSAGIVEDRPLLDLCYEEDSRAMVDLNCVMNGQGELIELQGTGEGRGYTVEEQQELVRLCAGGIRQLIERQKEIVEGHS